MHLFTQLAVGSVNSQLRQEPPDPSIPLRAWLIDDAVVQVVNTETGYHVRCDNSEWGILTAVIHLFRRSIPAPVRMMQLLRAAENPPADMLRHYGAHVPLRAFQYSLWRTVVDTPNYSPNLWVDTGHAEHKLYVRCNEHVYGKLPLTTAINSWDDSRIAQELIRLYQVGVQAIQAVHLEKPMPKGGERIPYRTLQSTPKT